LSYFVRGANNLYEAVSEMPTFKKDKNDFKE